MTKNDAQVLELLITISYMKKKKRIICFGREIVGALIGIDKCWGSYFLFRAVVGC